MDAFEWKVKANTIKQSLHKATDLKSVHFWKKKKFLSWDIQDGLYTDELSKCSFSLGDNHKEKNQNFYGVSWLLNTPLFLIHTAG